jgi:hypothetical protein
MARQIKLDVQEVVPHMVLKEQERFVTYSAAAP